MLKQEIVLEMKAISKEFPGVKALDQVDLEIRQGEVHALMGENGAGKSTLMNILCGKLKKDAGQILIDGKKVEIKNIKNSIQLGISMIHQELNFVPALTVADNIFLGKEISRGWKSWMNGAAMEEEAQKLLDEMEVQIQATARMMDLSVSQQQMVEIAKAISNRSRILIMDEPTSAITEEEVDVLFQLIRKLQKQGIAVIYISHKMDEIFQIADRITVLRDGKYIGKGNASELTEEELISMMVGRKVDEMFPKEEAQIGEVVLRTEGLCGEKFQDISFTLRKGEILGFSGLMGAGRTEIMRAIYGLDKLESGEIYIHGKKVQIRNTRDAIKNGIGFVSEDRKVFGLVLGMTVKDNITLASLEKYCRMQYIQEKKESAAVEEQIEKFTIKTPSQEQKAVNLSGGNQQKVVLAKTLLSNPDIIILDEPTRGIDVGAKAEIHGMISKLAVQGKAIIMISSEMPEILGMSDRVIVVHEGKLRGELKREEATQENIMQKIMAGRQEREEEQNE